jgi:membrane protease YdiL (CAAX protease family)
LSTLVGGLAFGWLNWRTGSILYSAAAHVFILTLLVANASG